MNNIYDIGLYLLWVNYVAAIILYVFYWLLGTLKLLDLTTLIPGVALFYWFGGKILFLDEDDEEINYDPKTVTRQSWEIKLLIAFIFVLPFILGGIGFASFR